MSGAVRHRGLSKKGRAATLDMYEDYLKRHRGLSKKGRAATLDTRSLVRILTCFWKSTFAKQIKIFLYSTNPYYTQFCLYFKDLMHA